ncbi:MAG: NAD(P)H-dependent flavin oxidoreductase [Bacteroidia bacterium]
MNRIQELFNIKYPIIQGGMVWCSGWRLASAVSNAGGLGLIGSGSMTPELLDEHITKCKHATNKPFGVNVPLLYKHVANHIDIILKHKVKIVFTSAGNPATYTPMLKENGITVVHVVSNSKFAIKAQQCGVDAIVAEGFEAGGHNGREETTTFCLIPQIKRVTNLPLIAAGGMYNGMSLAAAIALGAEGIQIGSRFAACKESSAHELFKQAVIHAKEGDTILTLKEITPVRLIKNKFYQKISEAYNNGSNIENLKEILGKGRAKMGIFEGNLDDGELEIGQVSALIDKIETVEEIINDVMNGFYTTLNDMCKNNLK